MRRFILPLLLFALSMSGLTTGPAQAASREDVRKVVVYLLECRGYTLGKIRCERTSDSNDATRAYFSHNGTHYSISYGGSYQVSYEMGPDILDPTEMGKDVQFDRPQVHVYRQEERSLMVFIGEDAPYDHMHDEGLSGKVTAAGLGSPYPSLFGFGTPEDRTEKKLLYRRSEGKEFADYWAQRYDKAIADTLDAFGQARQARKEQIRFDEALQKSHPQ
jgi:hypothetical protein